MTKTATTKTATKKDGNDKYGNNEDGNDDAIAKTVIDPTILASLATAITGAITNTVSNATATKPISLKKKAHSSGIDPYDSKSMYMSTKEGKYQWYIITKPKPG